MHECARVSSCVRVCPSLCVRAKVGCVYTQQLQARMHARMLCVCLRGSAQRDLRHHPALDLQPELDKARQHAHTCTCIHTSICTHTHARTHMHTHTYARSHTHAHAHTHRTRAHILAWRHTRMSQTLTCMHTHTHTHTPTRTHIHSLPGPRYLGLEDNLLQGTRAHTGVRHCTAPAHIVPSRAACHRAPHSTHVHARACAQVCFYGHKHALVCGRHDATVL